MFHLRTIEYLADPLLRGMYGPSVGTGLAIAVLAAPLSVLVVLKRLAFIGQGISHAAFGGWGLASVLAGVGTAGGVLAVLSRAAGTTPGQMTIVYIFCVLAALLVGWMSDAGRSGRGRSVEPDTAIGIVLVSSMALGAILNRLAREPRPWESFLFGSVLECGPADVFASVAGAGVVLLALWLLRRPLTFWAFDEAGAAAFGVRGGAMSAALMALLALGTVLAMRLVGVVPATALLVLPGAASLRMSRRSGAVLGGAWAVAVLGVLGGLFASFEFDLLPGASIVLALALFYAVAPGVGVLASRVASSRKEPS